MIDGSNDAPVSAVRKVAALKEGEAYSQARFLPAFHATPQNIRGAKRELSQLLSPVIARAKQLSFGIYRLHTVQSHTRDYDVVVAGVIVREPEPEEPEPTKRLTMAEIMERCGCGKISCDGLLVGGGCYVRQLLIENSG